MSNSIIVERETTVKAQYDAFDRLPPLVRQALRDAAFDFAAEDFATYIEDWKEPVDKVLAHFAVYQRQRIKAERAKIWGAHYPDVPYLGDRP